MLTLKYLSQNKTKVAYVIFCMITAALVYVLLIRVDLGAYIKMRSFVAESTANLQILKKSEEYRALIDLFNAKFSLERGTDRMIGAINHIAEAEGAALDLLRPLEPYNASGFKAVRIEVEGRAPFLKILRIISRIENEEKHLFIEEFEMNSSDSDNIAGFKFVIAAFGS